MATGVLLVERQILAASAFIEVLIPEADAGEIPAILATCRTPLPAASSRLARCALVAEIGGLPNLIDSARAAA